MRNLLTSPLLKDTHHGFSTKHVGDGRDREIVRNLSPSNARVVIPHQTHSTHVRIISGNNVRDKRFIEIPDTDGLVTAEHDVMLTVVTADCVPILYYDPVKQVIGISHGGWKGTLGKIPHKVIEAMHSLGSHPQDILVSIGPSIGPCCYEIYGERLRDFVEMHGESVIQMRNEKNYLDLRGANRATLQNAGIQTSNIETISECTSCNSALFFSYQRDKGIIGEMVSFIMLP